MVYDFKCDNCGKIEEKWLKVYQLDEPVICSCEQKSNMTRQVSSAGIQFVGKWYKNSGEY